MQSNLYHELQERRQARAQTRATAYFIVFLVLAAVTLILATIIYQIPIGDTIATR